MASSRMYSIALLPMVLLLATPRGLDAELARAVEVTDGRAGVAVVDVATGERSGLNADERFPMASVYKLPIAVAVLRQVQTGRLRLDQPVRIAPEDYYPGEYSPLRDDNRRRATTVTIRTLVERMVIESDNTACDLLIGIAGGAAGVMGELRAAGIEGIDVSRTEAQVLAEVYGLGPAPGGRWTYTTLRQAMAATNRARRESGLAAFAADARDTASPAAIANLLVRLARGEVLDAERTAYLLATMERTSTGARRLRAGLPAGTTVAHKTGTHPSVGTFNDVGLIKLPDGRLVAVAVLTRGVTRGQESAERAIAGVSRAVWAHCSGGR